MTVKKTQTYLFSYYHDGTWWSLEIPGYNREDALERLKKLPLAKYDGELFLEIPLVPAFITRLVSSLRLPFSQRSH